MHNNQFKKIWNKLGGLRVFVELFDESWFTKYFPQKPKRGQAHVWKRYGEK